MTFPRASKRIPVTAIRSPGISQCPSLLNFSKLKLKTQAIKKRMAINLCNASASPQKRKHHPATNKGEKLKMRRVREDPILENAVQRKWSAVKRPKAPLSK